MNTQSLQLIPPQWPAPRQIHAFTTTRAGGFSQPPYAGLNLALHVEDEAEHVRKNRQLLQSGVPLPNRPVWLNQVHGINVVCLDYAHFEEPVAADASYTQERGQVCAVMTADCLPLLICDQTGHWVAAAHGGWRGLLAGIIEATVAKYPFGYERLMVWLGPAIGPSAFEVGEEVFVAFIQQYPGCDKAFSALNDGKCFCDIYTLARFILQTVGIKSVYGGEYCTYQNSKQFYSYRREGITGRMASVIWID